MAEKGSFWSSLPGVLTGIAGLATAVVALLSLAASQGWIGGGGGEGGDGDAGTGDATPVVEVDPRAIEFQPVSTSRETTVAVTNGGTAPFQVDQPKITGPDADRFTADGSDCTGKELPVRQTCDVVVTFDPGGPGRSSARLVVSVNGAAQSVQVPIEAAAVLG